MWKKTVWPNPWSDPAIQYRFGDDQQPADDGGPAVRVLIEKRDRTGAWTVVSDRRSQHGGS